MGFPQEKSVVSDGTSNEDHLIFGLPIAAIICIAIVVYGLLVLICIFMRQVILNRRPLSTLESLHCCDCLLTLPRPVIKLCDINCGQPGKADSLPCRLHFEWLWEALSSVRCRPADSPSAPSCWPLPAARCPSSVRCCGLEIRRDARPGMVDASVSSGDALRSPALTRPAAPGQHGAALAPADPRLYTQHGAGLDPADPRLYAQHGAGLDPADSRLYAQHGAGMDPADPRLYAQHGAGLGPAGSPRCSGDSAESGLCGGRSTDARRHSQLGAAREPALTETGSVSVLSTAA